MAKRARNTADEADVAPTTRALAFPPISPQEDSELRAATGNLRWMLLREPQLARRIAVQQARESIRQAVLQNGDPIADWATAAFGGELAAKKGWTTAATWDITLDLKNLEEIDSDETPYIVAPASARDQAYWFYTTRAEKTPLGPGAEHNSTITHLSFWEFDPLLQSAGLGSAILAALTTVAMVTGEGLLLAIERCYMPSFLVADGRYGFTEQSKYADAGFVQSGNANPLLRYPPILNGPSVGRELNRTLIAWVAPSLRALHRYMQWDGIEHPDEVPDGVYEWLQDEMATDSEVTESHPFWRMLRGVEEAVAGALFPSPAADVIRESWLTQAAAGNLSDMGEEERDAYGRAAMRSDFEDRLVPPAEQDLSWAFLNPLRGLRLFLCTPDELRAIGLVVTADDVGVLRDEAFWKPLERVAPLRGLMPGGAPKLTLVVAMLKIAHNVPAAFSTMRMLVGFFVELARELGVPVVFDTRRDWPAEFAANRYAAIFDLDPAQFEGTRPNAFAWQPMVMGNGPAPFLQESVLTPGVYWFYPQAKPRTFRVPDAVMSVDTDKELRELPATTARDCLLPVVTHEGRPAPLARLAALRGRPGEARAEGEPAGKQPRYTASASLACTNCSHPQAAFVTGDGAFAFCGAHCQRRFEDGTDAM